ncbi:MAG: threonine/serine ThrE exporter family protein [Nocardioides sp.]|uniref:threonine/serine ThrE exporter family protein n=1 Tax=Nocardioides sp. TaxID=35761 RepID=UPI003D6A5EC3
MDAREVNLTLDFCLRVGELLMSTGAGAADVTATMRSLAQHLGLRGAEIDVTYTSLAMSYQADPEAIPVHTTRQVKNRTTDYDHLTAVDHLVRKVVSDDIDLQGARIELGRIVSGGHRRPRWAVTLGIAMMAGTLTVYLGGDLRVATLAFISAAAIDQLQFFMSRRWELPAFYLQVAGAGLATLFAVVAAALPLDLDVSNSITANITVMLAGIAFMGALQDALTGFHVTASARIMEALVSTAGIIAGVTGGLAFAGAVGVEIVASVSTVGNSLQSITVSVVGGAVAAAAFAYSAYAPPRTLIPIAVVAGIAVAISVAVPGDVGRTWRVAVASLFVGLVAYAVASRLKVPPLVVVVSGAVPFLPGYSIYRGLSMLAQETPATTSVGLVALFTAASVALALASGVILGEYIAQPLQRRAWRIETRLSGPRLVGPLRRTTKSGG